MLAVKFSNATIDYVLDYLSHQRRLRHRQTPSCSDDRHYLHSGSAPHLADNLPALLEPRLQPTGLGVPRPAAHSPSTPAPIFAANHSPGPDTLRSQAATTMLSWDYDFGSIDAGGSISVANKSGYVIIKQFPVADESNLNPAHGLSSRRPPAILNTTVQDLNATVHPKSRRPDRRPASRALEKTDAPHIPPATNPAGHTRIPAPPPYFLSRTQGED